MNYKDYIIKKGDKELGILWSDIQQYLLSPSKFEEFRDWMIGQTVVLIGDTYIVNRVDFERFIKGLPNLD